MAGISVSGTVCKNKDGEAFSVVSFKNKDGGEDTLVSFSVADLEYVYTKQGEDKVPQYYRCQLRGMQAKIAMDRLQAGMFVAARGQLIQREWNGQRQYSIDNTVVSYPAKPKTDDITDNIPF